MGRNLLETIMGAVVIVVAAGFLLFAYDKSDVKPVNGYRIQAKFSDVTGIGVGGDVRIGGLKIGTVDALELDEKSYQALVSMQISDDVKLPKDSSAAVVSSSLLGGKYIKLEPGGDDKMLSENGVIRFTQSSVSFEEMIGKFVFSGGGVESGAAEEKPADAPEKADKNPFSLGL